MKKHALFSCDEVLDINNNKKSHIRYAVLSVVQLWYNICYIAYVSIAFI